MRQLRNGKVAAVRNRSLHHQVAQDIGARILKGEFAPGDLLPNEAESCKAYGVSRTAVREAMSGNLCRCGAYRNICAAVQSVRQRGG